MESNNNTFITGEKYSLNNLFSSENRIIVPDLQRDYCWGAETTDSGETLVHHFIDGLVKERNNSSHSLGLIYGYETPAGHIQLCDGQQRITTLFLLLGMLNHIDEANTFKHLLISDFEYENDDKEPHLHYAIRETSLYFLSDLVCHFFIQGKTLKVDDIIKQPWFFKDYSYDPSILNIIAALKEIESTIDVIDDPVEFGKHIANDISFIYYDMGNRRNGEETFVVINTTGESLSATENLKPILITLQPEEKRKSCSDIWEKWETFFWKNRNPKENDTADNGMKEFFRWVTILRETDFESNRFKKIQDSGIFTFDTNTDFDEIDQYFEIVNQLFSKNNLFEDKTIWLSPRSSKDRNDGNQQIVWYQLLPVIAYIHKYPDSNSRDRLRVKKFFESTARIDNVGKNIEVALPESIRIINELPDADICSMTKLSNPVSATILSQEYIEKFNLYISDGVRRNLLEDRFWKDEEHSVWNGEIAPLISWSYRETGFNFDSYCQLSDTFNELFIDIYSSKLDKMRRAMLTLGLNNYPRRFRGINMCFCYEPSNWQTIIKDNVKEFGDLVSKLNISRCSSIDIWMKLDDICSSYTAQTNFAEFVKIPELLSYCVRKNIQWWGEDKKEWILLVGEKASGAHADIQSYKLYIELKGSPINVGWNVDFYAYDTMCVVFNKEADSSAIDLWHISNGDFKLQLFNRDVEDCKAYFAEVASQMNLSWNDEAKRYESVVLDKGSVTDLAQNIISFLG